MEDLGFQKMQKIQLELQEKYKDIWPPLGPDAGIRQMLWLMIEVGEAADVIKKSGHQKIMEDPKVRRHFIEEMADVMMYYNDVMLCFDISVEELKKIYLEKHEKNLKRW